MNDLYDNTPKESVTSEPSLESSDNVDEELEAMKVQVQGMESEAAMLREMQAKVDHSMYSAEEDKETTDARSVHVGQVDYDSSPEELEAHFQSCGAIHRVTILCDKFTGHLKGYAYVEFAEPSFVNHAVDLNGSLFRGRLLKVTPKRTNVPGFAARGRGAPYNRYRGRMKYCEAEAIPPLHESQRDSMNEPHTTRSWIDNNHDAITIADRCECDEAIDDPPHCHHSCSLYHDHDQTDDTNTTCSCPHSDHPPPVATDPPPSIPPPQDDKTKPNIFADEDLPLGDRYPHLIARSKKRKTRRRRTALGKRMVYISFLLILLGGIATFFCWLRIPLVAIGSHAQRHSTMTMDKLQLQTTWLMNMTLDNRENWIPTRLARMELTMVDSVTMASFASAVVTDLVLAPGVSAVVPNIVVNVSYMARVESDATWQALTKACVAKQGVDRAALNIKMKVVFHFWGILWPATVNASPPSGGFVCPL